MDFNRQDKLPFYTSLDPTHPKIWPNHTLIMPVCAVGNIGQLTCDLLISTMMHDNDCQLVGRIYSPALMSMVGPNAFKPGGVPTTSVELYECPKHKLVIMQQRTSYFKDHKKTFVRELTDWLRQSQFNQVIVLTSSFAQCNPDTWPGGLNPGMRPIRYIATKAFEMKDSWHRTDVKPLPDKKSLPTVQDGLTFLPGSGITKSLIKTCEKNHISALFLVNFCNEGLLQTNVIDSHEFANVLDVYLNLGFGSVTAAAESSGDSKKKKSWKQPYSWDKVLVN